MTYPVLDETQVCPRVQEVGGDRVLGHVEVPLGRRDLRQCTVVFHERVELPAEDRRAPLRAEEAGGVALPFAEVGLEGRDLVGTQGANHVRALLTSVGNEADRIGLMSPVGFTHVDSHALRALDEVPCGSGSWSSRYFPNKVEFIPHQSNRCLDEGCRG
jgi:hypothetical protein